MELQSDQGHAQTKHAKVDQHMRTCMDSQRALRQTAAMMLQSDQGHAKTSHQNIHF